MRVQFGFGNDMFQKPFAKVVPYAILLAVSCGHTDGPKPQVTRGIPSDIRNRVINARAECQRSFTENEITAHASEIVSQFDSTLAQYFAANPSDASISLEVTTGVILTATQGNFKFRFSEGEYVFTTELGSGPSPIALFHEYRAQAGETSLVVVDGLVNRDLKNQSQETLVTSCVSEVASLVVRHTPRSQFSPHGDIPIIYDEMIEIDDGQGKLTVTISPKTETLNQVTACSDACEAFLTDDDQLLDFYKATALGEGYLDPRDVFEDLYQRVSIMPER